MARSTSRRRSSDMLHPTSVRAPSASLLALSLVKCQSSEVAGIQTNDDGTIVVTGSEHSLTYAPRVVTLDDGTTIAHESQGGDMASVWATDLGGGWFVEVAHLGDGPAGGELVMTVTHIGLDETV